MKQGSGRGMLARLLAMAAVAAMVDRGPTYHTVASKYKNRDAFQFNTRKAHRDRVRALRSSGRHHE